MKYRSIMLFVLLLAIFNPINVEAKRGCCSHHGGVSHCDTSIGMYICNDGSVSPSCTCERIVTTKKTTTSKIKVTSTSSKLVTTNKINSESSVVMNINTSNNKKENNNENESNNIAATLGGLGVIGAGTALVVNKKRKSKK